MRVVYNLNEGQKFRRQRDSLLINQCGKGAPGAERICALASVSGQQMRQGKFMFTEAFSSEERSYIY